MATIEDIRGYIDSEDEGPVEEAARNADHYRIAALEVADKEPLLSLLFALLSVEARLAEIAARLG